MIMIEQQLQDVREIYLRHLDEAVLAQYIGGLAETVSRNSSQLSLHTRNAKDQPLSFGRTRYFSIISIKKASPAIVAGALESSPDGRLLPALRFRNGNPGLSKLNVESKFPYRKPGWTNVVINDHTVGQIPELLRLEVDRFFDERQNGGPGRVGVAGENSTSLVLAFTISLLFVLTVLVVLLIQKSDSTKVEAPAEATSGVSGGNRTVNSGTNGSVTKGPKSWPPISEFSISLPQGTISATVFDGSKYGRDRKLVIFAPLLEYTDESFCDAAGAALLHVFGVVSGGLSAQNARKEYDPETGKNALYWQVAGSTKRFYCFPIVDTATENVAAIVVWLE